MDAIGVGRRGPRWRFWSMTACVLLAVLLVHRSWPEVSIPWSIFEFVCVLCGDAPADGIPVALLWLDTAQAAKVSAPPAEPTRDARIAWLGSAASSR
jgi:hypothetical protein